MGSSEQVNHTSHSSPLRGGEEGGEGGRERGGRERERGEGEGAMMDQARKDDTASDDC